MRRLLIVCFWLSPCVQSQIHPWLLAVGTAAATVAAAAAAAAAEHCDDCKILHAADSLEPLVWQFRAFGGSLLSMRGREYQLALLSLLVTACSIGKGINNFADNVTKDEYHGFVPTASLVSRGNYDRLAIYDWVPSDHNRIVARHRDAATTTIAILALDGSAACDMSGTDFTIVSPTNNVFGKENDLLGEVVVLDDADGDGIGPLTFYDQNCVQLGDSIADASLLVIAFGQDRILVRSGSRLLAVEPRAAGVEVLAESLEQIENTKPLFTSTGALYANSPTWFIDGGQFAALDGSGKVTLRYGSQVTEVVRLDESDYLIDDGGELILVTPELTTQYATDICGLRQVIEQGYFEYRSPCPDGPLHVAAFNGSALQSVAIDVNADHVFAFDLDFDNPAAMFTRPSSDGTSGKEIWLRNKQGESQLFAKGVAWLDENSGQGFPYISLGSDGALHAQLAAIIDANDTSGRLVGSNRQWDMNQADGGTEGTDGQLLTQAEGVPIPWIGDPYYFQLSHFDGNVGDFIDPFPSGPAIAHGVPANLAAYSTSDSTYMALLADYESGKGRLGMMPANSNVTNALTAQDGYLVSTAATRIIRWLASDVAMGTFRVYDRMSAVGYIDQWDVERGAGRFVVHDIALDTDYVLSDSVRQQFEVLWPSVAVVYAVADGERQGIWVQKAH